MIGSYLELEAFRGDAQGKSLSIGGIPYTVVGVLAENADNTEGSGDDKVYIPYENAQRLSGGSIRTCYLMTSTSRDTAAAAKGIIENRLHKNLPVHGLLYGHDLRGDDGRNEHHDEQP